jgi:hypothetical protein
MSPEPRCYLLCGREVSATAIVASLLLLGLCSVLPAAPTADAIRESPTSTSHPPKVAPIIVDQSDRWV